MISDTFFLKNTLSFFIILFLLVKPINLYSQENNKNWIIGGTGNIGISKVTLNIQFARDYRAKYAFSGNFGMFIENKINYRSSIGIEALWVQIEGKEAKESYNYIFQNMKFNGVSSRKFRLHSSYIGMPVYYRLKIKKIGIKAGVQPMLFLFAHSNEKISGEVNDEPTVAEIEVKNLKFNHFDIGPKVGIDYKLNDRLLLRADCYYGLRDVSSPDYRWLRNRQYNLGLQYIFKTIN